MEHHNKSSLKGQVALVTGGSRGIGLGIAEALVERGARVVLTARKQEGLDDALRQLPQGSALGIAGRADDPVHQDEVLDAIAGTFGRLDVLVNNAGINPVYGPLSELDLDAARKVFNVNVFAGLSWVQKIVAHDSLRFREHRGRIIFLSSVTGVTPAPNIGLYGISKAAVSHLARTLAVELAPEIRVNAIAPAVVKTQFSEALYQGREEDVAQDYPLKRLGVAEDIGAVAAFLATDESSWITAEVMTLDGGLTAAGGTA
ncbi:SDR family oxidoreductase [Nesterenkonia aerolata]|uniref:SDR family oxidoreductase n=1 Tax=Nesterenkonia aerolata TaxID=3074079 RepID=A0ABU2DPK9_9MICC|nr:SDR family oxidoreductase [Nesterenkonia sp. LY-0111]MDR8018389.1 SDR family oxidoreductase [Nesterenkonia sp. LY-0111]